MSNAANVVTPPVFQVNSGNQVPNFNPPAKVLVLGCIDPRFISYLEWFLVHQKSVYGQFDMFTLAGASLGVNQAEAGVGAPSAGPAYSGVSWGDGNYHNTGLLHWDSVFYQHVHLAVELHSITDVWIFDHLDCAAYKIIKFDNPTGPDTDIRAHSDEIAQLALNLSSFNLGEFSELNVKGFVMTTSGDILKVYDTGSGVSFTAPGSSDTGWWILPTVLVGVVLVLAYTRFQAK